MAESLAKTLQDFSEYTSSHGLPQIGAARNHSLRLLWTVGCVLSVMMFVYEMNNMQMAYFAYAARAVLKFDTHQFAFPVVTLCPTNPWKRSRLTADIEQLVVDFSRAVHKPIKDITNDTYDFNYLHRIEEREAWGRLRLIAMNVALDAAEVDLLSEHLGESIYECSFDGHECFANDFVAIRDPVHGVCFQFNNIASASEHVHHSVTRPGPDHGLEMVLHVDSHEFLPSTETSSFVVVIHDQLTPAYPDAFGVLASASAKTLIGNSISRLGPPHGDCQISAEDPNGNHTIYSRETCHRACLQTKVVTKCSCAHPALDRTPIQPAFCASTDQLHCVWSVEHDREWSLISEECPCPHQCHETSFETTVSQSMFPALSYHVRFTALRFRAQALLTARGCIAEKTVAKREACVVNKERPNLAHLVVYFEKNYVQTLHEEESYGLEEMIFELGGQIGLWLGFSFITIFEFVGLVITVSCLCCKEKPSSPNSVQNFNKTQTEVLADKIIDFKRRLHTRLKSKKIKAKISPKPSLEPLEVRGRNDDSKWSSFWRGLDAKDERVKLRSLIARDQFVRRTQPVAQVFRETEGTLETKTKVSEPKTNAWTEHKTKTVDGHVVNRLTMSKGGGTTKKRKLNETIIK